MYDYLRARGLRCLYLIQRERTKEQLQKEFVGKTETLTLMTYQSLEMSVLRQKSIGEFDYIVVDEAQYFTNDGAFNDNTDVSFDWIFNQEQAVKVFMSATMESFRYYLLSKSIIWHQCNIPYSYGYINTLTFFYGDDQLEHIATEVIQRGGKAVFFIQSTEKALKLYQKFEKSMIFSCSKYNSKYKKYMNESLIASIVQDETFPTAILVTTCALDSGFNLRDSAIDTIVIDVLEPEAVIQCVGRKRTVHKRDSIDLYIRGRTKQQLNGLLHSIQSDIRSIIKRDTDEYEYHISNKRQNSDNHLVVNRFVKYDADGQALYVKAKNEAKVSRLMYLCNNLLPKMLEENEGYNKYLAKWFGFYIEEKDKYLYSTISTKKSNLRDFLNSISGIEMLTPKDRIPLIEEIHATNKKGKLLKRVDTLNNVLKESGYPHRILVYTKTIKESGEAKKYNRVWKVVNPVVA